VATLTWTGVDGSMELSLADETSIGRAPENTIILADPRLSKIHARILREGDGWVLQDAGSRNGSRVNGQERSRCALEDGDVVKLGPVELVFHAADTRAAGPESAPPTAEDDVAFFELDDDDFDSVSQEDRDILPMHTLSAAAVQSAATGSTDAGLLARRLTAGFEISKATGATLDLAEMLKRVLEALFGIFGAAERGFILLASQEDDGVRVGASRYRDTESSEEFTFSRTALRQVLDRREALLCMDAAADDRFSAVDSIADFGIRSMMIAPLLFRDQIFGAIHIDTLDRCTRFTEADLELLTFAATQVAGAVANAELHRRVVESARMAAVGETVAGLSHCIKNILQCIRGGAYLVDGGLAKGNLESVRSGWDVVSQRHGFMEELVLDLLQYAKPRKPEYELVDFNALCEETCTAGADLRQAGTAVTFKPDPALQLVEVDPKGIRRCLLNLLTNAVDACAGNGGTVSAETRLLENEGLVQLVVCDTGCGMSDETRAKLFTQFFSTKGSAGTGLGLALTRKIIEEHGGRIRAESREGEGSTFIVTLPATRAGRHPGAEA